jgi:transcriptional regulator with XRE-family HTH domain
MVKGQEIADSLGKIIRQLRMERDLSQEKLAELGNFERSYISKIENGERAIQVVTFIRFAKALNLKASDLMVRLEKELKE